MSVPGTLGLSFCRGRGFRPPVIVGQALQMCRVCSLGTKIKVIVLDEGGPIVCTAYSTPAPNVHPVRRARAVRCYGCLRVVPAHHIKRSCRIRTKRNKSAAINGAERSSRALRPAQFPNWKVRELSFWLQNQWALSNWAYVSPLSCIRLVGSEEASLAQSCSAIASSPRFVIR